MPPASNPLPDVGGECDYLCVDAFLHDAVAARALKSALELELIDRLAARPTAEAELGRLAGLDPVGLRLLLDLLRANRVTEEHGGVVALTTAFQNALRFRDLLEAKVDFALFAAADFLELFPLLLRDPGRFLRSARLFKLFDYRRCLDRSPENLALTRRWVRFTTALTRYEGPVCLGRYDFGQHQHLLDVGGNSGEFALRACRRHPALRATVFDLPLVCEVGHEHIDHEPEAGRIAIRPGDALADPLPTGCDLITFKSVLHDWPQEHAGRLIARAAAALVPGGTLLIFERGPVAVSATPPFGLIPMLLFFRSFRPAESYRRPLEAAGLGEVTVRHLALETPFFLVTAKKPG